jgi:DNA topoisomerase-1
MNRLVQKLEKIGRDPKVTAKAVGLRYVSDSTPGYTRKKAGKGWSYYDADGVLVKDKKLIARFAKLVIPPAYTTCSLQVPMLQGVNNTVTMPAGTKSVIKANTTACKPLPNTCLPYAPR